MPSTVHLGQSPTEQQVAAVVDEAAEVLLKGGAVVLPTDTVYGLAALPSVPGATAGLFELKARSEQQPMAVLVADKEQAVELIDPAALTDQVLGWMERLWPGALTIVLPRAAAYADLELGGSAHTVGVRCPDHDLLRALARKVGPLATTSANRHGEPTPLSAGEAAAALEGPVGLVIDGGLAGSEASTVVDATVEPWVLLRQGGITDHDLDT